jgi:DNA polymerase/3'-5' exonuclease PolX
MLIAGSLRRKRPVVSDIELLYVPRLNEIDDPEDMLCRKITIDLTEPAIAALLKLGTIAKRPNKRGSFTWGPENKLAVHIASGIPVDFFATTEERFFNALVVRTGPAESNVRIASAAKGIGWKWHAYGNGFTRAGETQIVTSERAVFEHVQLPYLEPHLR